MELLKNIAIELKINHYIKNLIVFIPLIFSLNVTNLPLLQRAAVAFLAFCAAASCVYVLNDLADIKYDKSHPIKSKRPVASGNLPVGWAIALFFVLGIFSFLCALCLGKLCAVVVLGYIILNVFYSYWLKNIVLVDAASIALGFIFRILIGSFAIDVVPSALVILLTFFLSLFFTYSKRKLELSVFGDTVIRKSNKELDLAAVERLIYSNAILSVAFYFTYVMEDKTIARAGSEYLYVTVIPFVLIIYRLLILINQDNQNDDPIKFFEKDRILIGLIVAYFAVFGLIYLIP